VWWREFGDGTNFQWIHLYAVFGYYKTEEATGWNAKNTFEGVQYDVEPTTSSEDVVEVIQVIWVFL